MSAFFYLIPVSLLLGTAGLVLFLWSMRNGQYEDLDGASERILYDEDVPAPPVMTGKRETHRTDGATSG